MTPLIVDAHNHVGHLAHVLSFDGRQPPPEPTVDDDAARRVETMDVLGIAWAVLQPSHGYLRADGIADTMRVNDRMAEYGRAAPRRLRVFGTAEPLHGQRGIDELDRFGDLGLEGVAWHHRFQGCYIDNPWMWPTLRRMSELHLVPLIHVNVESSLEAHWRLQRLALEFPELPFLAMDGFWSYERARHILMTAGVTPNVIWDLGGPACYVPILEWIERNGSTTLCFSLGGTYSAAVAATKPPLLLELERLPISAEDRANILGGNVVRILGDSRSTPAPGG